MRISASAASAATRGISARSFSPAGAARALSAATAQATSKSGPPLQRPQRSTLSRLDPRSATSLAVQPRSQGARGYSAAVDYGQSVPTSSLISTTTLPNRVRVATEETPGHFSAVGVYVDAGSRYERTWVPGESGVSHLLDRMAFKSTTNRSADQMTTEIEALGGNVMCSSSRETIMYQSSMFNQDLPAVLSILADTIQNPAMTFAELGAQREAAAYEVSEIWSKPEMILPELLHTVAYRGNTLGNPLLCPIKSLEVMTTDHVRNFMQTWFTPERIVVAGAGMPHEQLVELSERLFGGMKGRPEAGSTSPSASSHSSSRSSSQTSIFSSASSPSSSASSSPSYGSAKLSTTAAAHAQHSGSVAGTFDEMASARARYTGGEAYMSKPDLEFTHVYVAFEGVSIHDDDVYALATLQILLGGGGSFSAGGPGKGMYSRLYANVLNQYHAVDYCAAFHHCYADSGLFGIAASVDPSFNGNIAHVIARELELCTSGHLRGSVTHAELARARNQLKSSLVMALESRLVEVEDLGRQVQVHGRKVTVEEMCAKVDEVDLPTLHRVASRVLRSQKQQEVGAQTLNYGLGSGEATVVAQGRLDGLGDIRELLFKRGLGTKPTPTPALHTL